MHSGCARDPKVRYDVQLGGRTLTFMTLTIYQVEICRMHLKKSDQVVILNETQIHTVHVRWELNAATRDIWACRQEERTFNMQFNFSDSVQYIS